MATHGLPYAESEWEDLQRDCHPFPAYVDFMYGRPTQYETLQPRQPVPSLCASSSNSSGSSSPFAVSQSSPLYGKGAQKLPISPVRPKSAAQMSYTLQNPAQNSSSRQFLRDFQFMAASPDPVLNNRQEPIIPQTPPARSSSDIPSQPLPSPIPPLHILKCDELYQHQYSWIAGHLRHSLNGKLITLYSILDNPLQTPERLKQATADIISISSKISESHTAHLKKETAKRNLHSVLPNVFRALRARQEFPQGNEMYEQARMVLVNVLGGLDESMKAYAHGILAEMLKAESEGKNPLEAIPGYEPSLVEQQEDAKSFMGNFEGAVPAWMDTPKQASSPLPE